MADYPIIVRNKVPLVQRGFMLVWLAGLLAMTVTAVRHRPPDMTRYWPWILLLFWTVGSFALRWSMRVEAGKLVIERPRHATVERGPAFQRRKHSLTGLKLVLVETKDGDGDPYFHLMVDTPSGPLIVSERHNRSALEKLKERLEAAY